MTGSKNFDLDACDRGVMVLLPALSGS